MKTFGSCNALTRVLKLRYITCLLVSAVLFSLWQCSQNQARSEITSVSDSLLFLNHSDSAKYVGMNTCRQCHIDIYNTFIQTGMGQSFHIATKSKSAADFKKAGLYDSFSNLHYAAFWHHDSLFIKEYRLNKADTIHQRTEKVNYIIGSGQHTNSHLHAMNGYISQMPMTFYTQKQKWDLPPGFENGVNTRFGRKIGLECMSCHNAFPQFVKGSENKYVSVPTGIDCERCHGPGSIHVMRKQNGERIDTSVYVDRSIVNPAKLEIERQFDICQRCHLQGNAVLKNNRSFYDFKPGQKLSDFMSVFLPRYKNADDEFIMASHADRLKQSACYIKSAGKVKAGSLKPYKDALTCVTCHNPHVSVKNTAVNVFNQACQKCHAESGQDLPAKNLCNRFVTKTANCVNCHMPVSGSRDIPHVSVHDHYIRRPITQKEKDKIKEFLGLYPVNEKNPDVLVKAQAYLNQYEKFEQKKYYLDSAEALLGKYKNYEKKAALVVHHFFMKQDYKGLVEWIRQLGEKKCLNELFINQTYSNTDAWTCYRIGESFINLSEPGSALPWFQQAVMLAPYVHEFRNKYATALAATGKLPEAKEEFERILRENPEQVSPYANLGYIALTEGKTAEARRLYSLGEKLNPDYEPLLLNLAGYYIYMNDKVNAKNYLERALRVNPGSHKAKLILQQINR